MIKQEIIEKRKNYMPYEEAKKLQKQLINIYKKEYKPKHNANVYLKLILDYGISSIEEIQNNIYTDKVFMCSSFVSNRIFGYTKEHCLDQIYDIVKDKKQRIKYYKTLPTLEQLVNSEIEIDPNKTYDAKEPSNHKDECQTYSGNTILEIRKIGLDEYYKNETIEFKNRWGIVFPIKNYK